METNKYGRDSDLSNDTALVILDEGEEEYAYSRKNKEINTLVKSINDIAVLFKELSTLVVE